MKHSSVRKQAGGFTIIEVMIVLVIAAVILLIVFLAVPALQRNSRNTQRRNDVANLLAGVAEYAANHKGNLPVTEEMFDTEVLPGVNLGFYDPEEIHWNYSGTPLDSDNHIKTGEAGVYMGIYAACDGNAYTLGSSRQYAAVFNLESSGGPNQPQCQAG